MSEHEHPREDTRDEHWISRCMAHAKRMDELEEEVESYKAWRYGNGRNGIDVRIKLMEDAMPEMKKDLASMKKALWVGIGALFVLQPLINKVLEHIAEGK